MGRQHYTNITDAKLEQMQDTNFISTVHRGPKLLRRS